MDSAKITALLPLFDGTGNQNGAVSRPVLGMVTFVLVNDATAFVPHGRLRLALVIK